MHQSVVLGLALVGLSVAQTTATLYIPGADTQPLEASVIASDATATTYLLQCIPGTDSSDCGLQGTMTLTEGPATAAYTFTAEYDSASSLQFTGYMDCSLAGTTSAVCVESFGGAQANFPGISTETYTGTDQPYMPVIVTGLGSGSAAAPSSVSATTTTGGSTTTSGAKISSAKTSGSTTNSFSTTSGSTSGSGVAGQTTSSKTSVSTGGVEAATGARRWAFGGAAVALAMLA